MLRVLSRHKCFRHIKLTELTTFNDCLKRRFNRRQNIFFCYICRKISTKVVVCGKEEVEQHTEHYTEEKINLDERMNTWKEVIKQQCKNEEANTIRLNKSNPCLFSLNVKDVRHSLLGDELVLSTEKLDSKQNLTFFSKCKRLAFIELSKEKSLKHENPEIIDETVGRKGLTGVIKQVCPEKNEIVVAYKYHSSFNRNKEKWEQEVPVPKFGDHFHIRFVHKMQYQKLDKLLDQQSTWKKFPGHQLFLETYGIKEMRVTKDEEFELPKDLNENQKRAIHAAVNKKRKIMAIHGPPGTGKTIVIAEIIVQSLARSPKDRIVVCASSHKAVDNVLLACIERGLNKDDYVRIGGDNDPTSEAHFENLMRQHLQYGRLSKIYQKTFKLKTESGVEYKEIARQFSRLRNQLFKKKLDKISDDILEQHRVIFCTTECGWIQNFKLKRNLRPKLLIIDEAGQILESKSWPIIIQGSRVVLVGDHNQLGPINTGEQIVDQKIMNKSILEHFYNEFDERVNFFLDVQYRSNELIQRWSNAHFYDRKLRADSSVADICLADLLPHPTPILKPYSRTETSKMIGKMDQINHTDEALLLSTIPKTPLVLVDTDLIDADNHQLNSQLFVERRLSTSFYNVGEAIIVARYIKVLLSTFGLHCFQIGCITPYTAQSQTIRKHVDLNRLNSKNWKKDTQAVPENLDVSSVDSFQGQQREVIIMSFVRNNASKQIGFLSELKRINVAITRARRQFFLVASSSSLHVTPEFRSLYEIIRDYGCILSPSNFIHNKQIDGRSMKSAI